MNALTRIQFDAPTTSPIAAAEAYADHLDTMLASPDLSHATNDALTTVGELLGGLSTHGFRADLDARLDEAEQELRGDCGGCSEAWLEGAVVDDMTEIARDWLSGARAIMRGVV